MLQEIHDYVSGTNGLPLIIVGGSGCGKTSVLAVVMTESWQWLDGRGAIVYRLVLLLVNTKNTILTCIQKDQRIYFFLVKFTNVMHIINIFVQKRMHYKLLKL